MKRVSRDILRGTLLAMLATGASFVLARYALGRIYYLGVLLPAALMIMLLVAWLIYLKADGFFGASREKDPAAKPDSPFVPFEEGVLPRAPSTVPLMDSRDVMRALLWGAAELAVIAFALYNLAGIGSSLFR